MFLHIRSPFKRVIPVSHNPLEPSASNLRPLALPRSEAYVQVKPIYVVGAELGALLLESVFES